MVKLPFAKCSRKQVNPLYIKSSHMLSLSGLNVISASFHAKYRSLVNEVNRIVMQALSSRC